LTIFLRQSSVRTHSRRGGQYIPHIVGNLVTCHCAKKKYRNRLTLDQLIAKTKRVQFLDTVYIYGI